MEYELAIPSPWFLWHLVQPNSITVSDYCISHEQKLWVPQKSWKIPYIKVLHMMCPGVWRQYHQMGTMHFELSRNKLILAEVVIWQSFYLMGPHMYGRAAKHLINWVKIIIQYWQIGGYTILQTEPGTKQSALSYVDFCHPLTVAKHYNNSPKHLDSKYYYWNNFSFYWHGQQIWTASNDSVPLQAEY